MPDKESLLSEANAVSIELERLQRTMDTEKSVANVDQQRYSELRDRLTELKHCGIEPTYQWSD